MCIRLKKKSFHAHSFKHSKPMYETVTIKQHKKIPSHSIKLIIIQYHIMQPHHHHQQQQQQKKQAASEKKMSQSNALSVTSKNKPAMNQWHQTLKILNKNVKTHSSPTNETGETGVGVSATGGVLKKKDFPAHRQNQLQQKQVYQHQHPKTPPPNQWRNKSKCLTSKPFQYHSNDDSTNQHKGQTSLPKDIKNNSNNNSISNISNNKMKKGSNKIHRNKSLNLKGQGAASKNLNYHKNKKNKNKNNNKKFSNHLQQNRQNLKWVHIKEDTELHKDLYERLQTTLKSHGVFETPEGSQKRRDALDDLEKLLNDWAVTAQYEATSSGGGDSSSNSTIIRSDHHGGGTNNGIQKPIALSEITPVTTRVRLISFGSYRLGVHSPTSDLDVLALCPPHITRDYFFSSLVDTLKKDKRVKGLHPVPGAFTPVIKFFMNDLKFDLLFVRLVNGNKLCVKGSSTNSNNSDLNDDEKSKHEDKMDAILSSETNETYLSSSGITTSPSSFKERYEFEIDDSMLVGLDEPSVRSLNGVRVVQFLLDIIPDKTNFRVVLRAVKQWAVVHGLYSNVLGFLGGINWAILVAWICKRNAKASPLTLLRLFFHTFSKWQWRIPVTLTQIVEHPPRGVMKLTVWNPKTNPRDRGHLMPIITPVYPCMNSSYNVGKPQKRRLCEELSNGDKIMSQIAEGKAEWSELLKGNDFFKKHEHYLEVSIISTSAKDHLAWFGLCESRLRILIAGFESPSHRCSAYPFAKFFTRKVRDEENEENDDIHNDESSVMTSKIVTSFFIGLEFAAPVGADIDLRSCMEEFVFIVNSWEDRENGMDLKINPVLRKDLPDYVTEDNSVDLEKLEFEEELENGHENEKVDSTFGKKNLHVQGSVITSAASDGEDTLTSPLKKIKISKDVQDV